MLHIHSITKTSHCLGERGISYPVSYKSGLPVVPNFTGEIKHINQTNHTRRRRKRTHSSNLYRGRNSTFDRALTDPWYMAESVPLTHTYTSEMTTPASLGPLMIVCPNTVGLVNKFLSS